MKPYYLRYDDHYRSLYDQGIQYWSDGPDHCRKNIEVVATRLKQLYADPEGLSLLDVGCGEGHLAAPISGLGFAYTGIDVSPAAIGKARDRMAGSGSACFEVADAVAADAAVFEAQYDVVLDQACYHMLVLDADSRQYLKNVWKLLRDESYFLLLGQHSQEDAFDGPVESLEQYQETFQNNLGKPTKWEAWHDGRWVDVTLPGFACRPRTREAYLREVAQAGFEVREVDEHSNGHMLDFVLKRRTPG